MLRYCKIMLTASFARPVGMFDNAFNKFTSVITGGSYCHSEFIFSFNTDKFKKFLEHVGEEVESWEKKIERYNDDGMIHLCLFIVWGSEVGFRLLRRDHNNPYYRYPTETEFGIIELNKLSEEEQFEVGKYIFEQRKKTYDYFGALTFFIPLRSSSVTYNKYFCSQLMVAALQHVNKLKQYNPSAITPNQLHNLLLTM